MRKYYLFVAKKRDNNIFQILSNIKNKKTVYAFRIFNDICILFKTDVINSYLKKRYKSIKKNCYIIKEGVVIVRLSRIIILTNRNLPPILKQLNYYNKNIIVCDFDNKDYFWLSKVLK